MTPETPAPDTATPAPAADSIEFVQTDTPQGAPAPASEAPPAPILGKYKSVDDLAAAYQNLEQERGRLGNEVGQLRQMVTQLQQTGYPQHAAPAAPVNDDRINDEFRAQLERDPFGTLAQFTQMIARQQYEQAQAQQRQMLGYYQQFAQDPEYAEVANDAAQLLPFSEPIQNPVEAAFLRAKVKALEAKLKSGGNVGAQPPAPPFVESGSSRASGGTRVELDDRAAQLRSKVGDERFNRITRMVLNKQRNGGDPRAYSIDDYMGGNQ